MSRNEKLRCEELANWDIWVDAILRMIDQTLEHPDLPKGISQS